MKRLLLLVALPACQPRTELVVGIATDLHATDELSSVELQVLINGAPLPGLGDTWQIRGPGGVTGDPLPASYGIFADGDDRQIELILNGYKDGQMDPVASRHAIMSLVDGETLFYRMGITGACETIHCDAGQSCVEGLCRDTALDSKVFPEFTDDLVTSVSCNSNAQYLDTTTNTPMPPSKDATACPSSLCSEGTCLVPPNSDSIALKDLPQALAKAVCTQKFSCCSAAQIAQQNDNKFSDEPGCEAALLPDFDNFLPMVQSEIDAKRVVYHGEFLGACLAALAVESCTDAEIDDSNCDDVFEALVGVGGACNAEFDFDCTAGLLCSESDTCVPAPTEGQPCVRFDCAPGLSCGGSGEEVCTPTAKNGQSCQNAACAVGEFCDANTKVCGQTHPDGAACQNGDECASHSCSFGGGSGDGSGVCQVSCSVI